MFTRPIDLADADVARAVQAGWGLQVETIDYAPVGFGSHHWYVTADGQRWFVTVDDLDARKRDQLFTRNAAWGRLSAALTAALALRESGLERFVLTHGEPHRSNTIDTADGVVLIDWDTAMLAPPDDSQDMQVAWESLQMYLDPRRWNLGGCG